MKRKDIDLYEKVQSQIKQLYKEITVLSKKSPDNAINKFKLKFINEKLKEANALLVGKHKPFTDFETFDEDSLPTNSDVVLILSQYLDCLEGWRSDNVFKEAYSWYWKVGGGTRVLAEEPSRFSREDEEEDD
jgi:hypothetical protein